MELKDLQRHWNEFGKTDPLWAIISWEEKKGNKWKAEEFFETGRQEVKDLMEYVGTMRLLHSRTRALDFGCGVGRLTQALANYFEEAVGVDIAPSMIKLANEYNRYGLRCRYIVNEVNDLTIFESNSFDLVYTNIVLQHMMPQYAKSYIREFLRVLKPEGVLVFHLPSETIAHPLSQPCPEAAPSASSPGVVSRIKQAIKACMPDRLLQMYLDFRYPFHPVMQMYCVPRREVEDILGESGGTLVDVMSTEAAGPGYVSFQYTVTKATPS